MDNFSLFLAAVRFMDRALACLLVEPRRNLVFLELFIVLFYRLLGPLVLSTRKDGSFVFSRNQLIPFRFTIPKNDRAESQQLAPRLCRILRYSFSTAERAISLVLQAFLLLPSFIMRSVGSTGSISDSLGL